MSLQQYLQVLGENTNSGRVVAFDGENYHIITHQGLNTVSSKQFTLGDIVTITDEQFRLAPRKNRFQYKQLSFANFDCVFFLHSLTDEIDYPVLYDLIVKVWDCGVTPYLVLFSNGNDQKKVFEIKSALPGVDYYLIDNRETVKEKLSKHLRPNRVISVISFANSLTYDFLGQFSREIHYQQEVVPVENGPIFLIINTDINEKKGNFDEDFLDIDQLAEKCRFKDCKHLTEPGCKVREGVERGFISREHYENYLRQHNLLTFDEEESFERNNKKYKHKDRNLY
ncbi:MAG: hypothetical protein GX490_03770 [Bacilli bacterium]|nr:hypothetical protein [Bacilli bacterium]